MNKFKAASAILAIVLTAGISYATQNNARFILCYDPGATVATNHDCPNPEDTFCCYSEALSQGTIIRKENP